MLGLRTCIYRVSELDKAIKWYSKAFNTDPYFTEPYYVGFNIGGYELGLQPEEGNTKGSNIEAYWGIDNIQSEFDRMIALGATNHSAPMNAGGDLYVASVKDPWDNIIGLIYNPYFKLTDTKYDILHDVYIHATKEEIYRAVCLPKHLNNWWTKECTGLNKIGSEYNLHFSPEYDWKALVTNDKMGNQFELTMTKCSENWEGTKFGFIIEEQEDKCMLSFYHTEWSVNNHEYRNSSYCWALLLKGLKDYVENGTVIPFQMRG